MCLIGLVTNNSVARYTKIPPQVEGEPSRTSFPIRPIKQPYDGVFMLDRTFDHILWKPKGLGLLIQLYKYIIALFAIVLKLSLHSKPWEALVTNS